MLAGDGYYRRGAMFLSLLCGAVLALAVVLSAMPSAGAQEGSPCDDVQGPDAPQVPGAEMQDADKCPDLTTRTLALDPTLDHTRPDDWAGLHAVETDLLHEEVEDLEAFSG